MYKVVLAAVDIAPDAEQVCAKARALCTAVGAELFLLHVIEPVIIDPAYDIAPIYPTGFELELEKSAREKLKRLGAAADVPEANQIVTMGTTKGEILRLAEAKQADLVVVGSHGRHGLALLLGSTANAVLHGATCDVLAIRIR